MRLNLTKKLEKISEHTNPPLSIRYQKQKQKYFEQKSNKIVGTIPTISKNRNNFLYVFLQELFLRIS